MMGTCRLILGTTMMNAVSPGQLGAERTSPETGQEPER